MDPLLILLGILILVAVGAFVAVLRTTFRAAQPAQPSYSVSTPAPPRTDAATMRSPQRATASPGDAPAAAPAAATTDSAPATLAPAAANPATPATDGTAPPTGGSAPAAPVPPVDEPGQGGTAQPEAAAAGTDAVEVVARPVPADGATQESVLTPGSSVTTTGGDVPAAPRGDGVGLASTMELAGQPPTRSGEVRLAVSPQRLPYRFAELLGEQRQLEEAITLAHKRIDDVEMGPEPESYENRVRLNVLRQDLAQKQERLREVLFLQDGYRWLQQQMALDHVPLSQWAAGGSQ